jgi:hypothetical protein
LNKFPQPSALGTLGTEVRGNGKPLHGSLETSAFGRDHASEGRREFRTERVVVGSASPPKGEELIDNALSALDGVEIEAFEGRPFDLLESMKHRSVPPRRFDPTTNGHVFGIEVSSALWGLEGSRGHASLGEAVNRSAAAG